MFILIYPAQTETSIDRRPLWPLSVKPTLFCVLPSLVLGISAGVAVIACSAQIEDLQHDEPLILGVEAGTDRQNIVDRIGPPKRSAVVGDNWYDFYVVDEEWLPVERMEMFSALAYGTRGLSEFIAVPYALLIPDETETVLYEIRYREDGTLNFVAEHVLGGNIDPDAEIEARLDRLRYAPTAKANRKLAMEAKAAQGDAKAASIMAREYQDETYLKALAVGGNPTAAYLLYKQQLYDTKRTADSWKWLCKAADSQLPEAQAEIGYWHTERTWELLPQSTRRRLKELGIQPDKRLAHMWFTLAASNDINPGKLSYRRRDTVVLTTEERDQVEQMVKDWKPGDCPSTEHRLGPPGET